MMTRTEFYEAVRRDVTGMVSGPLGMIAQVREVLKDNDQGKRSRSPDRAAKRRTKPEQIWGIFNPSV